MIGVGVLILTAMIALSLFSAPSTPAARLLSWKIDYGFNGPGFQTLDPQTTTMVPIEVDHPGCTPSSGGDWLAPAVVNYTPWSVTITMAMKGAAANDPRCAARNPDGKLNLVGDYLSGVYFRVQLSEPLAGRLLLDGSSSPASLRPYR